MNLRQKLYLKATEAAAATDPALPLADLPAYKKNTFGAQEFDSRDFETWSHFYMEARGRFSLLSREKAHSETQDEFAAKQAAAKAPVPT